MTPEELNRHVENVWRKGAPLEDCDALRGHIDRLAAVRRAIWDAGPFPSYHREVMERHRREWPTLWKALDELLAPTGARTPQRPAERHSAPDPGKPEGET